jgi:nucleotide-binding universal stress UspA family protein
MFETIVVPLDGSSTAEVALPYAEEIAGRMGSKLSLIFVREPNDYRSENIIGCYLESMAQRSQKATERFLAESKVKEIQTETKILTGNPADEIINFAESQPGCHIIMATHGQSGTRTRWALGSVVDKVVRATPVPIGLIRAKGDKPAVHEPVRLTEILVPLDGSKESESVLPFTQEMAKRLKGNVIFMQVGILDYFIVNMENVKAIEAKRKSIEDYLRRVTQDFQSNGIPARYILGETQGDVAREINQFTEENRVDAVIMATHGHSGPRRWVLGSVSNKVMMEGNTPLILVRTPAPAGE